MFWQKSISISSILASLFSTAAASFAVVPVQLPSQSNWESKIAMEWPEVPNRGGPESTAGGGTRGEIASCSQGETPLTALMPTRNNIGKTAAAKPTFFVYVPKTTAAKAEFLVVDSEGNDVYEKTFELHNTTGIVKLNLPKTAPDLEIGKEYEWQFAIVCDPEDREADEFIQGEIERAELSQELKTKIDRAEPLDRAKLYAGERIWNDTLAILAELRSSNEKEWKELLKSVGLEAIASAPLTSCCTAPD